jgi:hypothetical protein
MSRHQLHEAMPNSLYSIDRRLSSRKRTRQFVYCGHYYGSDQPTMIVLYTGLIQHEYKPCNAPEVPRLVSISACLLTLENPRLQLPNYKKDVSHEKDSDDWMSLEVQPEAILFKSIISLPLLVFSKRGQDWEMLQKIVRILRLPSRLL